MRELLEKVERELDKIGEKGLTSSNLDTVYKLIDIYKDIKESKYYEEMCGGRETYNERSRSRYNDHDRERHYHPWDERVERYFGKIKDGIDDYSEGRDRYRDGDGQNREQMIKGIDMAMSALVSFVETLYDHTETPREKDVIKEHIEKLKKL